jgi:hypothetical protein
VQYTRCSFIRKRYLAIAIITALPQYYLVPALQEQIGYTVNTDTTAIAIAIALNSASFCHRVWIESSTM